MYPIYFYICLLASLTLVIGLILLAIFPIKLPLVANHQIRQPTRPRKVRSPTRAAPPIYWDQELWDDDEDDL